jgi:sporulation protein YlmC with PRC-barrel domain
MGAAAGAGTGGMAARLIDLGFPKEFLRDLQDSLEPGSSALVALVEPTWIDRVIKELADPSGRLFRYTLGAAMVDLPVKADVYCADGHAGHSTYVIGNPDTQQVTHLVVKEDRIPFTERVVSVDQVAQTTHEMIRLRCTKDQLAQMPPFIQTEYILADIPNYEARYGLYPNLPLTVPVEKRYIPVEHQYIPAGELAVHRGAAVEATDGHVGRVDEFLVDPENERITFLVMRQGHLWGQKEVSIPVSAIARVEEDTVYLKLDKATIEALPAVPAGRRKMP